MAEFDRLENTAEAGVDAAAETAIPPECKVIFFNDDYTTKDFVVDVLSGIFHKNEAEAVNLMEKIHTTGSAVIGVYTYDIAETLASLATARARQAGFPLRIEVAKN